MLKLSKSSLTMELSSATVVAMKDSHAAKKKIDSNLAPLDGNDVTIQEGLSAESIGSSTSRAISSIPQSREKVTKSDAFGTDQASSQHSDTTLKLSNSGYNEGKPARETKNVVTVKPQSSRLHNDIGDHQTSTRKTKTSKRDKSKTRKKPPSSRTTQQRDDEEALSDNGTWRPLVNSETKMSSQTTAKMIDKERNTNSKKVASLEKIASSGDTKRQHSKRSDNYCEDGNLKKEIKDDIAPQLPSRRSSALVRSQSLPSLEITESNSTPSRRAKRDDRRKDKDRRSGSSPRHSSRPKKDILSISEHRPKSFSQTQAVRSSRISSSQRLLSNHHARSVPDGAEPLEKTDEVSSTPRKTLSAPTKDKVSQSEHTISKPKSSRRRQLSNVQSPVEQRRNMEYRVNARRRTEENVVRRSQSNEALSETEQNPSRPRQEGRSSIMSSSWGDLTLECESDSEDKSSKRKKNWKAQCSWDLSQLILMEELLAAQPEKEDSRKEKVKEALFALTKKLLGSRKDDNELAKPRTTMEDSCRNNISLFDDSYQQNFGSTNINFGMFAPGSRSAGNVITDQSREHDGFPVNHEKTFPILANEEINKVNGTRNTITRSMNETTECKNSSNNDTTSDEEKQGFCSQGSFLQTRNASEVLSPTLTPNTQGSSSSNRRGRNRGRVAESKEKKASSWRELYKQLTPGQASTSSSQARRATSLIRKISSKRIPEQRLSSFDDDFISPRTVTSIVLPSTITTIDLLSSPNNEKVSVTTEQSNTHINSARQRGTRRRFSAGGTMTSTTSGSRELDLLQW